LQEGLWSTELVTNCFDALNNMLCFPDLHKLDEWKILIPNDLTSQEWLESDSSSDAEDDAGSESDSESDEEQTQMEVDELQQ
jgi:hypothetical protein